MNTETTGALAPLNFTYQNLPVRALMRGDEPWFVAADVCEVLGISKYRDAIAKLDEDERCPVRVDTLGGPQEMAAVSESGLYTLILRSDKPEAKPFRRWVTKDVLPSIRRSGSYALPGAGDVRPGQAEALKGEAMMGELLTLQRQMIELLQRVSLTPAMLELTPMNARRWTKAEQDQLTQMHAEGMTLRAMAQKLGRTRASVAMRVRNLQDTGFLPPPGPAFGALNNSKQPRQPFPQNAAEGAKKAEGESHD